MSDDLQSYMKRQQMHVDEHLRGLLRGAGGCPAALMEAMSYSLLAPGKRLRPILVLMASEACGGQQAAALPAACAVEMVHTYSLVHDDLPAMDDDDLRRGLPTCHKKFGEALAILAGDALLTLAFQALAEHYPPSTAAAACRELARGAGAAGMVGGQVLDLAWEKGGGTADDLAQVHALKTGALFRACLQLGILAAQGETAGGPDSATRAALDEYGRCFGLIFQITDDLLDVQGSATQTGKRVQKDAGRGKLTYPGLLGAAASRRRADELAEQALHALRPLGNGGERLAALLKWIQKRDR